MNEVKSALFIWAAISAQQMSISQVVSITGLTSKLHAATCYRVKHNIALLASNVGLRSRNRSCLVSMMSACLRIPALKEPQIILNWRHNVFSHLCGTTICVCIWKPSSPQRRCWTLPCLYLAAMIASNCCHSPFSLHREGNPATFELISRCTSISHLQLVLHLRQRTPRTVSTRE